MVEGRTGSELLGPPDTVDTAGMLLATEPGSSKASTGAHALGPLTLPATARKEFSASISMQGKHTEPCLKQAYNGDLSGRS